MANYNQQQNKPTSEKKVEKPKKGKFFYTMYGIYYTFLALVVFSVCMLFFSTGTVLNIAYKLNSKGGGYVQFNENGSKITSEFSGSLLTGLNFNNVKVEGNDYIYDCKNIKVGFNVTDTIYSNRPVFDHFSMHCNTYSLKKLIELNDVNKFVIPNENHIKDFIKKFDVDTKISSFYLTFNKMNVYKEPFNGFKVEMKNLDLRSKVFDSMNASVKVKDKLFEIKNSENKDGKSDKKD